MKISLKNRFLLSLVGSLAASASVYAQTTNVWTGSTSGVINVSGNYQSGVSISNDGNPSASFVFGRVNATNRNLTLPGEFKANQLQFESNGGGGFSLSGSFLNFVGGSTGIFQNSSQAVTISSGIKVSDGPLTLGGTGTGLITLSGSSGNDFGGKGITKSGTSAFLITQSITSPGTLLINGGTLAFSGSGNIAAAYQLRGGVVATSGTFNRTLGTGTTNVNFGAGGGGFAAYGGALTVSTALGTWASTGNSLANNTSLILGSSISNGVVTLSSNLNLNNAARSIQLVDNANSASDWSVMSGILSNGGLTITGSGRLILSGTNTFTGVTRINGGTLSVATIGNGGVAGNLGQAAVAASNLVLGGGTLQYTGATASTNRNFTLTASTTSTIHVTEAANALTISGASADTTGALTKSGAGTLTLSGANLHTGLTTVSEGTLRVNGSTSSSSAFTVASGATLAGSGNVAGTVAVSGNVAPGNGTVAIGTLNTGTTSWNGGSNHFLFDLATAAGSSDKLAITGNFTKGTAGAYKFDFLNSAPATFGNVYNLVTWTGSTTFAPSDFTFQGLTGANNRGTFSITNNTLQFTAIPEASNLLIGGLLGLGLMSRRRKQA